MGFFVDLPEHRKGALPDLVGPIVRLGICNSTVWNAVIFVACRSKKPFGTWSFGEVTQQLHPEIIGEEKGWFFVRFVIANVSIRQVGRNEVINYEISLGAHAVSGTVPVASTNKEWNIVAYSCYDQRRGVGEALWRDLARKSDDRSRPVHAILGGGDQLYNDNVWALPSLEAWLKMPKNERIGYAPDKHMQDEVTGFYLDSYLRHVHFHPAADFLRNVPQVNTWDDHDIFDGYGSYPPTLQNCAVFDMIFSVAQRFYLIFQHATNAQLAKGDGYLVNELSTPGAATSFNFVTQLGPSVAVIVPDSRSQRSRERIIPVSSLRMMRNATKALSSSTKHIIVLSAIPIVYPALGVLEKLLSTFEKASRTTETLLFKTGLYDKIYNHFGEPDLQDDVTDHWSSKNHNAEKAEVLEFFRDIARDRDARVTIVSGDVHLGAFTYLKSVGKAGAVQATDPGFIPQIVTSGIGNNPPGDFVVKFLESCVKQGHKVTPELQEMTGALFKGISTPSGSAAFNNRMNYCELNAKPFAGTSVAPGLQLNFVFLGGDQTSGDEVGDSVEAVIPPLLPSTVAAAAALEMDEVKPKKKGMCFCCV